MGWRLAVGVSVLWVALAFLGDGLAALVLPAILATNPDAATSIGLISFVGLGLGVVVQPIAGYLSDRWRDRVDRRWFIGLFIVPTIVGLTALAAVGTVAGVAVAFVIVLIAASGMQAGQQTLIPESVPEGQRGRAASVKTSFDIGGAFVAFLVLGAVLEASGVMAAAAVTAVVLVGAFAITAITVPATRAASDNRRSRSAPMSPSPPFPTGFAALVASRFLFLLGIYVVGRFLLLLVAERLAIPADRAVAETGGLLALFTLTTAGVALAVGPMVDRIGRRRLAGAGAVAGAVGVALLLAPAGIAGVIVAGILMSIGTAAFSTANWAALTDLAPPADAGRLMGLANIGTGGAAATAGLLGPAIDAWGFAPALIAATIAILLSLLPLARAHPVGTLEGAVT
ncbi:MAG: MFS transporter [Chloroflexota bacterium]